MKFMVFNYKILKKQAKDKIFTKEHMKSTVKISLLCIAVLLIYNLCPLDVFAISNPEDKANEMGKTVWNVIMVIGYWICAIYAAKDIIREIAQGNTKDIIKVVTKYVIGFALLIFFLDILDFIKSFATIR